jgi:predicted  nucleic acid-binding Zn-ribbon protein
MRRKTIQPSYISFLLITAIVLNVSLMPATVYSQQKKPIVISIGQPNIWSLEQAHYLLARMHRQNLDLQTSALGELNPNETNAQRVSIVRQLISAGFKFDEAVRINNELLRSDKTFNSERRQELLTQRTALQSRRTQISSEITELEIAKARTTPTSARTTFDPQIEAKTRERAAVEDELKRVNDELTGLNSASGDFSSVTAAEGFDSQKLPGSSKLDALIPSQRLSPSIAASQRLENHIGMQYEIIAKQLTLLRDEVGPGERLVFLELPQSINLSQDQEKNKYYQALRGVAGMSTNDSADNKMAQVWWRIDGYTRVNKDALFLKQLNDIEIEMGNLEAEIRDVQTRIENKETGMSEQLTGLKNTRQNTENELGAAKIQLDAREKRVAELLDKPATKLSAEESAELEKITREVSGLREKIRTLPAELSKTTTAIARMKMQISLQTRKEELNARLIKLCTDESSLSKDLETAENEVSKRKTEIKDLKEKIAAPTSLTEAEKNEAKVKIGKLEKEILDIECIKIRSDLDLLRSTISQTREALQTIEDHQLKLDKEKAKLVQSLAALYTKYEKLQYQVERNKIRDQRNAADRLLQGGGQNTATIVDNTIEMLSRKPTDFLKATGTDLKEADDEREYTDGRTYISLNGNYARQRQQKQLADANNSSDKAALLRNRSIRVIDVIPRQNAINVDSTKQTVKATGIVAAFSFLFGFGGNVRYQRQSERFEEFLNQELYTSGFGKGNTDFGWSFFPVSGTKQMSPGVRTTYAVAVIPEDAESVVLKAQGCYFPRREKQPVDYNATVNWKNSESSSCSNREQVFVLPVPGGAGTGADFYINELWYSSYRAGGRMMVSIYGQNISPQIGVTINGVPLTQAVGLAQVNIESILNGKVGENCETQICGRFERISTDQIVISFKMPDGYKGTPRISLIAPGKAIEINNLNLSINGNDDVKLDESPPMFGKEPPDAPRSIGDFKFAPDPAAAPAGSQMIGVASGKYESGDTFYVNGSSAKIVGGTCKTANLCIINFPTQQTDFVTLTVVPANNTEESISKTFTNPALLKIISSTIAGFVKATGTTPALLTIKIDGSGFSPSTLITINETGAPDRKLIPSSGQMILDIKSPPPVVQITLTDPATGNSATAMITTPAQ